MDAWGGFLSHMWNLENGLLETFAALLLNINVTGHELVYELDLDNNNIPLIRLANYHDKVLVTKPGVAAGKQEVTGLVEWNVCYISFKT